MPAFALPGRAAPAFSTPLDFLGLRKACAQRPRKSVGRPMPSAYEKAEIDLHFTVLL